MRTGDFCHGVLSVCAAAAMLSGCGAAQLPIGAPSAPMAMPARRASGSSSELIYVATAKGVIILSYPEGQVVGSIPWSLPPSGLICSDPNDGNVFIPEGTTVYEYAHGATTPFGGLAIPSGFDEAQGCAVDPTTRSLAVSVYGSSGKGPKSAVAIFPSGKSTPTVYSDITVSRFAYPAYDDLEDLFVAAYRRHGGFRVGELELGLGKRAFKYLRIQDGGKIQQFSGVTKLQWDGTYLDLSTTYGSLPQTAIDQVQIGHNTGKVINAIQLGSSRGALYFWIQNGTVLAELRTIHEKNSQGIGAWPYPTGGNPMARFTVTKGKKDYMWDITVSVAPAR